MPPSHLTRPDNLVKEALRGTERMQGKIVIPPKDYEIKNRIADGVDLFYFTSFPSNEEKARRTAMQAHRGQVVLQKLGERGVEVTSDMSYYVEAYVAVETTMSARWMRNRMDRSPEEMGHLLSQCVPRPLFEALEL